MDTLQMWLIIFRGLRHKTFMQFLFATVILFIEEVRSSEVCSPDSYNQTASGTDLWCYDCTELYTKTYDPTDSPCKNNLSQIALRQCGPRDRYCKVERRVLHGQTLNMDRGCVETCYYGCRFNGFGLTYMKCTSCCRKPGCNDDNGTMSSDNNSSVFFALCLVLAVLYL